MKETVLPAVTVRVINEAGIDPVVLRGAGKEAVRIFRHSGIRLNWMECSPEAVRGKSDPCHTDLGPSEFWLRVVIRRPSATSQDVLGFSELDETRRTGSAGIYYPAAHAASARFGAGLGEILGSAAAHELGHLLLGVNAHSPSGVMVAHWSRREFELLSISELNFTRDQSRGLRDQISSPRAAGTKRGQ
jgi:hypothetical protein